MAGEPKGRPALEDNPYTIAGNTHPPPYQPTGDDISRKCQVCRKFQFHDEIISTEYLCRHISMYELGIVYNGNSVIKVLKIDNSCHCIYGVYNKMK